MEVIGNKFISIFFVLLWIGVILYWVFWGMFRRVRCCLCLVWKLVYFLALEGEVKDGIRRILKKRGAGFR